MTAADDLRDPLPPVKCGSTTVLVDRARPVAARRAADGTVQVVTWAGAPLPARSATASVLAAPSCVWVVDAEESVDDAADPASTAVRVGADGSVAGRELGILRAIGSDDVGVWLSPSPYLAMEKASADGDAEEPDDEGEVLERPPAWALSAPVESWEDSGRVVREASDARRAVAVERSLAAAPLGDPPPPSPTGPVALHRVGADGAREEMTLSRVVSRIDVAGVGMLRVAFHPTGPVRTADEHGGYGVQSEYADVQVRPEARGPAPRWSWTSPTAPPPATCCAGAPASSTTPVRPSSRRTSPSTSTRTWPPPTSTGRP